MLEIKKDDKTSQQITRIWDQYTSFVQTDVTMKIMEGIVKLRGGVNQANRVIKCQLNNPNDTLLFYHNKIEHNHSSPHDLIQSTTIQLFVFLLAKLQENSNSSFTFEMNEYLNYCDKRLRSENRKQIIKDLEVLSNISHNINGRQNKSDYISSGFLLRFKIRGKHVDIDLEDWSESLDSSKYTLIHNAFFKYTQNQLTETILSLKLSQLSKLNNKKQTPSPVNLITLIDLIVVNDHIMKKRGLTYFANRTVKALDTIQSLEGYSIQLNQTPKSHIHVRNTKVYYNNDQLFNHYQT